MIFDQSLRMSFIRGKEVRTGYAWATLWQMTPDSYLRSRTNAMRMVTIKVLDASFLSLPMIYKIPALL